MPKILNMSDTATLIGVSYRTLQRYVAGGVAPPHTTLPGGKHLFDPQDVLAWKARRKSLPAITAEKPAKGKKVKDLKSQYSVWETEEETVLMVGTQESCGCAGGGSDDCEDDSDYDVAMKFPDGGMVCVFSDDAGNIVNWKRWNGEADQLYATLEAYFMDVSQCVLVTTEELEMKLFRLPDDDPIAIGIIERVKQLQDGQ